MVKRKIFISSVQGEFFKERKTLWEYLMSDPLLGLFFEPFAFEQLPAVDRSAKEVYLKELEKCDIYLGILGKDYGYEDQQGISPTEREFDHATKLHKTKFVYLSSHRPKERHPKEQMFIDKAQHVVVRKQFNTLTELLSAVYASLISYMLEQNIIQKAPFDAAYHQRATLDDIDTDKLNWFIRLAQSKRGFPLNEGKDAFAVLTHLNVMEDGHLRNAALLLFGKEPQRFFLNSEVRCARFYGNVVEKPIPSYKVFKGNVFDLVDQSVDFILSKLDYRVGTRSEGASAPGSYEIPREIITEAVVNAIVHRDYSSTANVQVMIFKNRIEILNPGTLPLGWTTEKLKNLHTSVPPNQFLAEPMYLAAYIERIGTGTSDMINLARSSGLKEPEFIQDDGFKVVIYRPSASDSTATAEVSGEVTVEATGEVSGEVKKLLMVLNSEMKRSEIQDLLDLKHDDYFRVNYILPALELKVIEMTVPDKPNNPNQKYRLTELGKKLQNHFKKKR